MMCLGNTLRVGVKPRSGEEDGKRGLTFEKPLGKLTDED